MTEDEYYAWFSKAGFERTGGATNLTEEFVNAEGTYIMVTKASELSKADRAAAVERYKMYCGIGYPVRAAVH